MGMGKVQGNKVPAQPKKLTFEKISRMSSVERPIEPKKAEELGEVDGSAAKKAITYQSRKMGMAKFFAKKAPVLRSVGKVTKGETPRTREAVAQIMKTNDFELLRDILKDSMLA